jgi:hypothetical protein
MVESIYAFAFTTTSLKFPVAYLLVPYAIP